MPAGVDASTLTIRVAPFTTPAGEARLAALADRVSSDLARAMGDAMRDARIVREGEARYDVEGEVRSAGADVVVALRLLDGADRKQLDNERAAMPLAEAEAHPERMEARTLSAARDMVDGAEIKRVIALKRPLASAREFVAKASWLEAQGTLASIREARVLYDEALRRDPSSMPALIGRANSYVNEYWINYSIDNAQLVAPMDRDTMAAVTLDPRDADAWSARSFALLLQGRLDAALDANARARSIDPTRFRGQLGTLYIMTGRADQAVKMVEERNALLGRVDPDFRFLHCHSLLLLGRYADARRECELAVVGDDNYWIWIDLASLYAQAGMADKASRAKDEVLRRVPDFTLSRLDRKRMSTDPVYLNAVRDHLYPGLRKAGLPE
jgi:tetratricopeptide (TPR) repeat protein